LAQNYDLIGFVRNLPDGRVELVVEGEEMSVQAFLEAIGQEMGGYIRNTQVRDEPCSGRETSFRIAF
jgi:acylphosphatase